MRELLTSDRTFLNERLARHYGIASVRGPQFRRVTLEDPARFGLLGKGAVLLRTSYGDRTSPVLRGAWVLDKLMGTPPTPPPPNVVTDLTTPAGQKPKTIRARLEQHRVNQTCNGCHGVIDPYGLALENFTATGQWREFDKPGRRADRREHGAAGGAKVAGPVQLREALLARADQFVQAFTQKLMMYAVGRELEYQRHAAGARDRARGRGRRLSPRGDRRGHRDERRVPPPGAGARQGAHERAGRRALSVLAGSATSRSAQKRPDATATSR